MCAERNYSYTTTIYTVQFVTQYNLLHYNNKGSAHFQEQKEKKIIKGHFFHHFLFYCMFVYSVYSSKHVVIQTHAYNITHDENIMSSLMSEYTKHSE